MIQRFLQKSLGKMLGLDASTHAKDFVEPLLHQPDSDVAQDFFQSCREITPARVLEIGTYQAVPGVSTMHRPHFGQPGPAEYVCLDVKAGADVDVVGDLHALPAEWTDRFDAIVAVAVFEHLERPWIAAREMARVLAPGGRFYVSTHQCFPIHAYPNDFFRFSKDALRLIFEDAGLIVEACEYKHRCGITPPEVILAKSVRQQWNDTFPSYILVEARGVKKV